NRGSGTVPVSVIDATGRTVLVQQHSLALGINTLRLNTGRLSPGLYLVRVGSGALGVAHRFVKAQ
ncbi:MAG: T9SS type A sorting domain-containing protein, partial [Flavobacteriales bacterium]|nr:T9SS type A sorting domain-containing protein [Flavobacteriales bacterium]